MFCIVLSKALSRYQSDQSRERDCGFGNDYMANRMVELGWFCCEPMATKREPWLVTYWIVPSITSYGLCRNVTCIERKQ
jgi:hypothetical protein